MLSRFASKSQAESWLMGTCPMMSPLPKDMSSSISGNTAHSSWLPAPQISLFFISNSLLPDNVNHALFNCCPHTLTISIYRKGSQAGLFCMERNMDWCASMRIQWYMYCDQDSRETLSHIYSYCLVEYGSGALFTVIH